MLFCKKDMYIYIYIYLYAVVYYCSHRVATCLFWKLFKNKQVAFMCSYWSEMHLLLYVHCTHLSIHLFVFQSRKINRWIDRTRISCSTYAFCNKNYSQITTNLLEN